jgi:hypothetical protein
MKPAALLFAALVVLGPGDIVSSGFFDEQWQLKEERV